MRKEIRAHKVQAPYYDPNKAPVMDINRIKELLPHRYPMLFVDKAIEMDANSIVAMKNVTGNEPFFQGHFPGEPVVPGVLLIEALAQAGGLLVLSNLENPEEYSTYFLRIDNCKFTQKVVPGDTLLFKATFTAPFRHNIAQMHGYVFVGENVVAEANLVAQVIKNQAES